MPAAKNIIELRELLARKFPGLSQAVAAEPVRKTWPTGLARLDDLLAGGFAQSAITELITPGSGTGSAALIGLLLEQVYQTAQWMALIDGQDSFDPTPFPNEILSRLLWIRCRHSNDAVKAADLLLRDGNLPLVLIDLSLNSPAQLRKISSSIWYRLQRLVEQHSTAVLVFSPQPIVSSAEARLAIPPQWTLDALDQDRQSMMRALKIILQSRDASNAEQFANSQG